MGIQRLFSQLRKRISGAAKMDEDSLKDEEKGIELSEPLPNDGTGRSNTPSSEDSAPDLSGQSAGVATLDEPPLSDLPASAGIEEPVLTEVPSGSASAETDAGIQPPVPFEKFQEVLESREKLYDRFLRKQAEFENFRKRTEKEKQEFYDFALSNFIKELLPVLDS